MVQGASCAGVKLIFIMKRTFVVLTLIFNLSSSFSADNALSISWSFDDDSLLEVLPKKMRDKNDDEVQKAVFQAYENQLKVISEYSGHLLDPEPPLGYFKDEMPITNTRTSNPQSDLIFYNNGIRGFVGYNKNSIIIKWVPNQVVTEIEWKELSVRGKYTFINSTFFNQGKYLIQLLDVKYFASTTLSENTEAYPSTVSKSSVSYKSLKASFTGGLSDVLKTSDSPNVKHFVEDIIFQQVADRVVKDTHNNITVAVRRAVERYVIFKNDTDQHFPGASGKLSYGTSGKLSPGGGGSPTYTYTIGDTVVSGFGNMEQKLKKVATKMATSTVQADVRMTVHGVDGRFDYKVEESSKPIVGKATFTVNRIDVGVTFNMLKPTECKAELIVDRPSVKYLAKLGSVDGEKALTDAFVNNVKSQLSSNICKALGQMYKSGK